MFNQDYKEIISLLLEEKADFLIIGAYAMAAHGFPRATGDIDIFIKTDQKNSQAIYNALLKFGAPLSQMSPQDFESDDLIFQIGLAPRRIDIITHIDAVSFQEALKAAMIIEIDELKVPVISKSALIKNKRSTGRAKDLLDVETLESED